MSPPPCCLSPAWKSTFDTRTGCYFQFLQVEARPTWQRREPEGYFLFACEKKDLPRCRNTPHSVAPPSCPYKFHTSVLPPVLRNRDWLPGPRKSTIVARPPFRAIAKWRPEVGWGRDYVVRAGIVLDNKRLQARSVLSPDPLVLRT